jgi:oligosaccharyltransferase complex subunit alpha (ribophorin I)
MQISYSYLDVVGRTTVVLKKKNVVGEHNVPFQVLVNILMKHCLTTPLNHASLDSNPWNILATSGVL